MSNYEKVYEFHRAFELDNSKEMRKNIVEDNPALVKFRLDLIREEFNELIYACGKNDFKEIRDAIGDILYVVYGTAVSFGINADSDFDIIHKSNMSKLCDTEDEAIATVKDYEAKIADGNSPYDSPYYYYREDIKKFIVKNRSTGKVLKNINYKKVKWNN